MKSHGLVFHYTGTSPFFLNKTEKKRKLLGSFNKNYDICAA